MKNILAMIITLTMLQTSAVMAQEVEIQDPPPMPDRAAARERFANMTAEEREQRRAEREERRANMSEEEREQMRAQREERMSNMSEEDRAAMRERRRSRRGG